MQSSVTFLRSHFTYCLCSLFSVPSGSPLSVLIKSCLQEENLLMPAGLCRRMPELKASRWPVTWHWSIRLKSQSPFKRDWILWGL